VGIADLARDRAARARAQAAGLDALGLGVGERVAIVSHNSARLFTSLFGVSGFGRVSGADQLPAQCRRDLLHRRALGCVDAARRSRARRLAPGVDAKRRMVLGAEADAELYRFDLEPEPWRAPDEDAPPPSTTRAAPPRARRVCR
jgi:hypothetical protein